MGKQKNIWQREILTIKTKYPEAIGETLIYRLYDNTFVSQYCEIENPPDSRRNNEEISKAALDGTLPTAFE